MLNDGYAQKRRFVRFLLASMMVYQIYIISGFSAQTARQSSADSNGILEKILNIIFGMGKENIDADLYHYVHSLIRKMAHFALFFTLGFICIMHSEEIYGGKNRGIYRSVLVFGLIAALADEGHQYFVPGRSAQITDVCTDFSGVIAGNILFNVLKRVFRC